MKLRDSKTAGIAVILAGTAAAGALAAWVFVLTGGMHLYLRLFMADAAATLFVYLTGLALRNASAYDPYWSVAPPVILLGMMFYLNCFTPAAFITLGVIGFWAVRLTVNWGQCFSCLAKQDWRYTMLREKTGVFYPLVSLIGIHFVPTMVVYLAMLPAVAAIQAGGALHPLSFIGWGVCVLATALQLAADVQMARFRKTAQPGDLIRAGLWKHSRHPNYLGEILMWWGVYLAAAPALGWPWALAAGALANTLLFLCVSIPMADGRYRAQKPGYDEYRRHTRMLLPLRRLS